MPQMAAFLAHRRVMQEAVIFVEQSSKCPIMDILQMALGDLYVIQGDRRCPRAFGHVGRRDRWWVVCLHKEYMTATMGLEMVMPIFRRECATNWDCLLISEVEEQEHEIRWAMSRRTSLARVAGKSFNDVLRSKEPFEECLTG